MALGLEMQGKDSSGNLLLKVTGLPGQPKTIAGLVERDGYAWSVAWSGGKSAPENRDPLPGRSITVKVQNGLLTIKLVQVTATGELIGRVTHLRADHAGPVNKLGGVTWGDLVSVPKTDYVWVVDTSTR